jgi:hypothetical protein
MEVHRRKLLEEVMCRLIEQELDMVWALSTEFGEELAGVIRRHLRSMGRLDVLTDAGRVEGLVIDVALWFFDHGAGYDPAASLPWVWADKPIRSLVAAEVGHRAVELEPALEGQVSVPAGSAVAELGALADREPSVALLIEAAQTVGSERDALVHLEYRVQKALGDPSPSHTVADMVDLHAANIRQIDTRMRKKVARLISADDRFRSLEELAWLK